MGRPASRPASPRVSARAAGRAMSAIFFLAGLMTLSTTLTPAAPGFRAVPVALLGGIAVGSGVVAVFLPWSRWPVSVTAIVPPMGFLLIGLHNYFGGADPYRHSIYLMVVFAWVGTFHRRGMSLLLGPMGTAAYLVPLLVTHAPPYALWSAAYAAPMFIGLGEVLAWRSEGVTRLQSKLTDLAATDQLTGLANRRSFVARLEDAVQQGDPFAVFFLDLDDFKHVNDRWGHAAGDRVLVDVAAAVQRSVRTDDLCVRVAGDEFAVVVDGTPNLQTVQGRLLEEIAAVLDPGGEPLGASVGFAVHRTGESADDVVAQADQLMYEIKRAHRAASVS